MTFCEQALAYTGIAAGTYFWLWYLTQEIHRYKGNRPPRWFERDLFKRRESNDHIDRSKTRPT